MSAYTLPPMAEQRLAELVTHGGADTLLLKRPQNSLSVLVMAEHELDKLQLSIGIGGHHSSLTLLASDRANTRHAADYIEALANGTAETASYSHTAPAVAPLLPCWKCKGEAIGFDYCAEGPGTTFLHGAKCQHRDCQTITGCESSAAATSVWNTIQLEAPCADHAKEPLDMVNHPPHYNGHPSGVECIEVTEQLPFNLGNAFKYVFRHRAKNGREDLEKARWYLAREQARGPRTDMPDHISNGLYGLAERIAAHEPYPIGAALTAIAFDAIEEATRWVDHLIAGSEQQETAA